MVQEGVPDVVYCECGLDTTSCLVQFIRELEASVQDECADWGIVGRAERGCKSSHIIELGKVEWEEDGILLGEGFVDFGRHRVGIGTRGDDDLGAGIFSREFESALVAEAEGAACDEDCVCVG